MTAEAAAVSYDAGPDTPALLETTIGADLAATAARFPDREVLVDLAEGRRFTYRARGATTARSTSPTRSGTLLPGHPWSLPSHSFGSLSMP